MVFLSHEAGDQTRRQLIPSWLIHGIHVFITFLLTLPSDMHTNLNKYTIFSHLLSD